MSDSRRAGELSLAGCCSACIQVILDHKSHSLKAPSPRCAFKDEKLFPIVQNLTNLTQGSTQKDNSSILLRRYDNRFLPELSRSLNGSNHHNESLIW